MVIIIVVIIINTARIEYALQVQYDRNFIEYILIFFEGLNSEQLLYSHLLICRKSLKKYFCLIMIARVIYVEKQVDPLTTT